MVFESVTAFLAMDGHGFYVWSAFGVTAVVMFWLVLLPAQQYRNKIRRLAMQSEIKPSR